MSDSNFYNISKILRIIWKIFDHIPWAPEAKGGHAYTYMGITVIDRRNYVVIYPYVYIYIQVKVDNDVISSL